jgi:hypothetical protein
VQNLWGWRRSYCSDEPGVSGIHTPYQFTCSLAQNIEFVFHFWSCKSVAWFIHSHGDYTLNPKPMRKFWKKETEWYWSCILPWSVLQTFCSYGGVSWDMLPLQSQVLLLATYKISP